MPDVPKLNAILETALYVADLERAERFYGDTLGLRCIYSDFRMRTFDVGGRGVLLIFPEGGSLRPIETPGGLIPPHDGRGPAHLAFSIDAEALRAWEDHLAASGITVEGRTRWPRGGISLYFRDPDGHLLELATPGLWRGY